MEARVALRFGGDRHFGSLETVELFPNLHLEDWREVAECSVIVWLARIF